MKPFSDGPRNCLGKTLAWLETKVILARILYNFDLELCEESKGWLEGQKSIIFWDRPQVMVKLTPALRK